MISVNDLKTGLTLELDNGLWSVIEFLHVKPGKGAAFVKTKLKKIETGQVVERTFRAGEKVAKAMLDRKEMQYLYKEGADFVMMDTETYEQMSLTEEQIGDEVARILDLYDYVYSIFGLDYSIELSTRPVDNFIGEIKVWDEAEEALTVLSPNNDE